MQSFFAGEKGLEVNAVVVFVRCHSWRLLVSVCGPGVAVVASEKRGEKEMNEKKDINVWFINEKHFALQFERNSLSLCHKLRVCWNLFCGKKMKFYTRGKVRWKTNE